MSDKNVAEMTSKELATHIADIDEKHKRTLKALRALQRVREEEEAAE